MADIDINVNIADASETEKGIIEIATQAETNTGTDDTKALTPLKLEQSDLVQTDVAANTAKVTNATHTGEVTGGGALTLDKTAISGKTLVTALPTDHVLIGDASDSDNLKKALVSDLGTSNTVLISFFHTSNKSFTDNTDVKISQIAAAASGVIYTLVPLPAGTVVAAYTQVGSNSTIASSEDCVLKLISNDGADSFTIATDFKLNANRVLEQDYTGLSEVIVAGGGYIQVETPIMATNANATTVRVHLEIEL